MSTASSSSPTRCRPGWGRTGEHFWGFQAHDLVPDLATFAKGLGNGLAIGGVVGRGDLIDSVDANSISTFGGNPLAAAGALANLEYLLSHDLQGNALKVGSFLLHELEARLGHFGVVAEIRGKGLMVGIELVEPGGIVPSRAGGQAGARNCAARGLLDRPGGSPRKRPADRPAHERDAGRGEGSSRDPDRRFTWRTGATGTRRGHHEPDHTLDRRQALGRRRRTARDRLQSGHWPPDGEVEFAAMPRWTKPSPPPRRHSRVAVHLARQTDRGAVRPSGPPATVTSTTLPTW